MTSPLIDSLKLQRLLKEYWTPARRNKFNLLFGNVASDVSVEDVETVLENGDNVYWTLSRENGEIAQMIPLSTDEVILALREGE